MLVTSEEEHERRSLFLCFDLFSSLLCFVQKQHFFHLETITMLLVKEPVVFLAHLNIEHALFLLLEVEEKVSILIEAKYLITRVDIFVLSQTTTTTTI